MLFMSRIGLYYYNTSQYCMSACCCRFHPDVECKLGQPLTLRARGEVRWGFWIAVEMQFLTRNLMIINDSYSSHLFSKLLNSTLLPSVMLFEVSPLPTCLISSIPPSLCLSAVFAAAAIFQSVNQQQISMKRTEFAARCRHTQPETSPSNPPPLPRRMDFC